MGSGGAIERDDARGWPVEDAALFRLLVERVVDYAIFLLTPEGRVASWNAGAQRLKGYRPQEIIGQSFERFYPDEARAAGLPRRLLAAARADGRVENEGWRVRKDGTRFWADVVITALRDESGQLVGYAKVTRDLSERRRAERDRAARLAAERSAERIERLQVATAALAAASRPDHAAEVLTDWSVRAVGADSGVVAFPSRDAAALEVADTRGAHADRIESTTCIPIEAPHPLAYAWRTRRALFAGSREQLRAEHPELAAHLATSSSAAWAVVPLCIEERPLAVLGVSFLQARMLDAGERGFLLALAEVGAQAIDRALLYASEQQARTDAEAAMRAQEEFLSIAAHELRTPVAAVKATAQLAERTLARGHLDLDRTARYLHKIAQSSDHLTALIADLLDVSLLRSGRLQVRPQQVDLDAVVRDVVSRYTSTESSHRFKLCMPEHRVSLRADPLRIEQILDNLLSNAVKYAPDGGPIEVRLQTEPEGVTLSVTDHGIGLPAGQEARVFEAFGRASNAAAQRIQGLGLGLNICRQLAELHGGRMWATSRGEGRGATFGLWLPIGETITADANSDDGQHA